MVAPWGVDKEELGGKNVGEKWKVSSGSREKQWRSADTWRRSLNNFTESWKLCISHWEHSHSGMEVCENVCWTIKTLFTPKTVRSDLQVRNWRSDIQKNVFYLLIFYIASSSTAGLGPQQDQHLPTYLNRRVDRIPLVLIFPPSHPWFVSGFFCCKAVSLHLCCSVQPPSQNSTLSISTASVSEDEGPSRPSSAQLTRGQTLTPVEPPTLLHILEFKEPAEYLWGVLQAGLTQNLPPAGVGGGSVVSVLRRG